MRNFESCWRALAAFAAIVAFMVGLVFLIFFGLGVKADGIQQPAHALGAFATNDCAKINASGFLVSAGGVCGTGSGSGTVTSVATGCGASGGTITTSGTILGIGVCITVANEAGTGTTNGSLAKYTGTPSTAIITGTSDTAGAVGVVVSGGGTTGSALIQTEGIASCQFDGSGATASHYVIISTTAGRCKDVGAAYPTSGQVIGTVLETWAGNSFAPVDLSLRQAIVKPAQIFTFGGGFVNGGSTIAATIALPVTAPAACTIIAWELSIPKADTGTATVKFLRVAAGTASPAIGDSINTSGVSLASGTHIRSTTLSDFTSTAVTAGDVIAADLITVGGAPTGLTATVECQ